MYSGTAGAHMSGSWRGVTGSDMGCRTLRCYVNSGVGHGMSGGVPGEVLNREVTSDQVTRLGMGHWPTRKEERGGASVLSGQRKSP